MTSAAKTSWIKVRDFEESVFWVTGNNAVTETPITQDGPIELGEVSDHGLYLKVSNKSCALGHQLILNITHCKKTGIEKPTPALLAKGTTISLTAKVIELEDTKAGCKIALLKLSQYDEKAWREFLEMIANRQHKVKAQVEAIKGES